MAADVRIVRWFEVALNDNLISWAISPTDASLRPFRNRTIAIRRLLASALNIRSVAERSFAPLTPYMTPFMPHYSITRAGMCAAYTLFAYSRELENRRPVSEMLVGLIIEFLIKVPIFLSQQTKQQYLLHTKRFVMWGQYCLRSTQYILVDKFSLSQDAD